MLGGCAIVEDSEKLMLIGVPKEVKDNESRVGIVPSGVKALADAGHQVLVESNEIGRAHV